MFTLKAFSTFFCYFSIHVTIISLNGFALHAFQNMGRILMHILKNLEFEMQKMPKEIEHRFFFYKKSKRQNFEEAGP